jgi:hypothetical protein
MTPQGIYPTAVVVLAHIQSSVLDDAAASNATSTLRMAEPAMSGSSGTWPTHQLNNAKRTGNEIELDTGLHSGSHDLERSQNPPSEPLRP